MMRSGDVSVSHSTQALVTAAAADPSTVTGERRQQRGEKKKKEKERGSAHLSHFHTQLALSPAMGKKRGGKKMGMFNHPAPSPTPLALPPPTAATIAARTADAAVTSFRGEEEEEEKMQDARRP